MAPPVTPTEQNLLRQAARAVGGGEVTRAMRERAAAQIMAPVREYPAQWRVACALRDERFVCVTGPRRAGKTEGVERYMLALLILVDGFTYRILTNELQAPTQNWLERSGLPSAMGLLRATGLLDSTKVQRAAGSIVEMRWPWGSMLRVHDVAREQAIANDRGCTAHVWHAHEAQDMPLLSTALLELVFPTLADHGGSVVLDGTPGKDLDGYFASVVLDEDTGADEAGWKTYRIAPWHNPRFGDDDAERWRYLVETVIAPARKSYRLSRADLGRLRRLTPAELDAIASGRPPEHLAAWLESLPPELRREVLGEWLADLASYVYRWRDQGHYFARVDSPIATDPSLPLLEGDLATRLASALALLPKGPSDQPHILHEWRCEIGFDLGDSPDPDARVAALWAPTCETAYLIHSDKIWRQHDSAKIEWMDELVQAVRGLDIDVRTIWGDFSGMRKSTQREWDRQFRRRLPGGLPVRLPAKHAKPGRIRAINLDMDADRIKGIAGDPLDIELCHLKWRIAPRKPGKVAGDREVDKDREVRIDGKMVAPGDHCADGLRYLSCGVPFLMRLPPPKRSKRPTEVEQIRHHMRALHDAEFGGARRGTVGMR